MSIYCTLISMRVNKEWVSVQGVPGHIDDVGPAWEWLPPPVGDEDGLRAIFVVDDRTTKGTARNGQEYVDYVMQLTVHEYINTSIRELRARIREAVIVRQRARTTTPLPLGAA